MKICGIGVAWAGLATALALWPGMAWSLTRTATGTGYWTNPATWDTGVPTAGEDAVINSGVNVTLDASTFALVNVTNNGTITFLGTNTLLTAVGVYSTGLMTHAANTDTNGVDGWAPDHRVWIACSNLTISSLGRIDVNGKGYAGGGNLGQGPSGGKYAAGGGYGGNGGNYNSGSGGAPYGSAADPQDPGSGGSRGDGANGGAGGGLVRIEATGVVTVDGSITANGGNGSATAGGGAGGGIYVRCLSLDGSGALRANGGGINRGGGGGRIAVIYNPTNQPTIGVPFITAEGHSGLNDSAGGAYGNGNSWPGSLYFPDNRLLPETITFSGEWSVPSLAAWSPTNLVVSNGWVRFMQNGLQMTTGDLLVTGTNAWMHKLEFTNATVVCSGSLTIARASLGILGNSTSMPSLTVAGSMTLTNSANAKFYAGATNGGLPGYGALVSVANDLTVWSNCWVYSYSHPANGGSVFYQAMNVTIATPNAGFSANAGGFGLDSGPGKPQPSGFACGAGYGGEGGRYGGFDWGKTYGDSNAPALPGSGSLTDGGAVGGGLVWIDVARAIRVNGTISATGAGIPGTYSGGSGGGIYLVCKDFIGAASGLLEAKGGSARRAGGGGRIAVWRVNDKSTGAIQTSVANGVGTAEDRPSSPGTIVWGFLPAGGTVIMIR